jgi:hypothetical protein
VAPRTVRGLLTAFQDLDPANVLEVAADLDALAIRLDPPPPPRPPTPGYPHGYGPSGMVKASIPPAAPLPGAAAAAKLARQLAGMVRRIPAVIVALRSLTTAAAPPDTAPLYAPDPTGSYHDLGTGDPAPTQYVDPPPPGDWVRWWPVLPPAADQVGYTSVIDVPPEDLVVHFTRRGGGEAFYLEPDPGLGVIQDLICYAGTMADVRGRDAGWHQYARNMRGGGHHAAPRRRARAAADSYHATAAYLEPFGDRLAADLARYLETTWSALTALVEPQGETMPTLTSSAVVTSLATRIRDAITSGHGGRLAVSDSEQAFAWQPNQATTLLTYLNTDTVTGRHTTVVTAQNAATVVGPVAEGAAKPTVVDFTSDEVDLVKYAGMATITVESAQFVANIEAAVSSVLVSQITRAIEKDAVAAITAAAGVSITAAADITAGVLSAIAGIRENGGNPTVVGLSSTDWLAIMTATGGSGYLNFAAESGPGGTWLGLAPVILPGQAAGAAIVADGSSVSLLEPAGGPLCVVDVYSQLANNKIVIAVEEWATTQVTSPGGVATVAVTP